MTPFKYIMTPFKYIIGGHTESIVSRALGRMLAVIALLLLTFPLHAQLIMGYCDDNVTRGSLLHSGSGSYGCAVALTPELQQTYSYCDIQSIHIGLCNVDNISQLQVWLRRHLTDEEPLAVADADVSQLVNGWNEIPLPSTISLPGDTLYCGYSYTQTGKVYIPFTPSVNVAGSTWLMSNNKWKDYSSKYGPLYIRAGLLSRYANALQLHDTWLGHRDYLINADRDSIVVRGTVTCMGASPLTSFLVTCVDADGATTNATVACTPTACGYDVPFELHIRHGVNGYQLSPDVPLTVGVSLPNGEPNEYADAHLADTLYYELGETNPLGLPCNLLIEEFTSERSGYAPAGQTHLREALPLVLPTLYGPDYQELVGLWTPELILLSHHEGYGPADPWHITDPTYDATLFGSDCLTFAPGAIANRHGTVFSTTLPEDSIARMITGGYAAAYADVQLSEAKIDLEARTVSVLAQTSLFTISHFLEPVLTICLVQDSVPSIAQVNYYPDLYDGEWQHDVVRCYLDVTEDGRLIQGYQTNDIQQGRIPIGNQYSHQFEAHASLPDDIQSSGGLRLVAYIYDAADLHRIIAAFELKI